MPSSLYIKAGGISEKILSDLRKSDSRKIFDNFPFFFLFFVFVLELISWKLERYSILCTQRPPLLTSSVYFYWYRGFDSHNLTQRYSISMIILLSRRLDTTKAVRWMGRKREVVDRTWALTTAPNKNHSILSCGSSFVLNSRANLNSYEYILFKRPYVCSFFVDYFYAPTCFLEYGTIPSMKRKKIKQAFSWNTKKNMPLCKSNNSLLVSFSYPIALVLEPATR